VPARTDLGAEATPPLHEHFVDPRLASKLGDYEREFQRLFAQAR
jgi:hypothetical protein